MGQIQIYIIKKYQSQNIFRTQPKFLNYYKKNLKILDHYMQATERRDISSKICLNRQQKQQKDSYVAALGMVEVFNGSVIIPILG